MRVEVNRLFLLSPNWIEEGHATARGRGPSCQCNANLSTLPIMIDIGLFTHEIIQQYAHTYLNLVTLDQSLVNKC